MGVVYRDKRGVEYESVPLATSEVTDAVPLDAHIVSKRVVGSRYRFMRGPTESS